MGAWETGNFGNDDAMDFVGDITETNGKDLILSAIQAIINNTDYIESSDCCTALAAIEFIAAAKGNACDDFPEEAEEWLSKNKLMPFTKGGFMGIGAKEVDVITLSSKAIEKIKTESELKELWEESGEFEEWLEILEGLKQRIA
jgi:Domain of unknown function (DUF4259)